MEAVRRFAEASPALPGAIPPWPARSRPGPATRPSTPPVLPPGPIAPRYRPGRYAGSAAAAAGA